MEEVVARFDAYFIHKKRSFCRLIAMCQAEGWIEKKAPRTKSRVVGGESPGEGGGGG